MKWENDIRQFSSGKKLILGKWNVGTVFYDSCRPKGDPVAYQSTCTLPGIKGDLGHYEEEDAAKLKVEKAVEYWIKKANLKIIKEESEQDEVVDQLKTIFGMFDT